MTTWRIALAIVAAACGEPRPSATSAHHDGAANATEAARVLDELNRWCAQQGDDCDVAMRSDAYPNRAAAGETNGWISSHRDRLHQLGLEATWTEGHFVMAPQR
jgi:hypothetical protein